MARVRVKAMCVVSLILCARTQIRVVQPQWLVDEFQATEGRIEASTATFGAPFYGEHLRGRLMWDGRTYCEDDILRGERAGAGAFEGKLIRIFLVRRGSCSFVEKVQAAQKRGAHAVIIVDSQDSELTADDISSVIIASNSQPRGADIPSMLVTKGDGQRLIDATEKGDVQLELSWEVPIDHRVVVDYWMSSASRASRRFLRDFAPHRRMLSSSVHFVPHYHVFSMRNETGHDDVCADPSAQFCADDPDGPGPLTGRMVLDEDVRQLCIHELTSMTEAGCCADKYWQYVALAPARCPLHAEDEHTADAQNSTHHFGQVCSEELMRHLGIDVGAVAICVRNSWAEKLERERTEVAWSPRALRINGWMYSGALDPDLVTRAICSGFHEQPQACRDFLPVLDALHLNEQRAAPVHTTSQLSGDLVSSLAIACGAIGVAAAGAAAFAAQRRTMPPMQGSCIMSGDDVLLQMQTQMTAYEPLPS